MVVYVPIRRKGTIVGNIVDQMEQLRIDRVIRLAELNRNTHEMRAVAAKAHEAGQSGYRIAKLLGVTTRTVYLWLGK